MTLINLSVEAKKTEIRFRYEDSLKRLDRPR